MFLEQREHALVQLGGGLRWDSEHSSGLSDKLAEPSVNVTEHEMEESLNEEGKLARLEDVLIEGVQDLLGDDLLPR